MIGLRASLPFYSLLVIFIVAERDLRFPQEAQDAGKERKAHRSNVMTKPAGIGKLITVL